MLKMMAAYCNG